MPYDTENVVLVQSSAEYLKLMEDYTEQKFKADEFEKAFRNEQTKLLKASIERETLRKEKEILQQQVEQLRREKEIAATHFNNLLTEIEHLFYSDEKFFHNGKGPSSTEFCVEYLAAAEFAKQVHGRKDEDEMQKRIQEWKDKHLPY